MTNDQRIATEKRIARSVAEDLITAGFTVTVNDGEDDVLERSTNIDAILDAMFSTDDDYLLAYLPGAEKRTGWVRFIYGNDGYDVINDYTVNLEDALARTMVLVEELENAA